MKTKINVNPSYDLTELTRDEVLILYAAMCEIAYWSVIKKLEYNDLALSSDKPDDVTNKLLDIFRALKKLVKNES